MKTLNKKPSSFPRGRNLRIIGLYLREMGNAVSKTLRVGWYPFGNYPEPKNRYIDLPAISKQALLLYRTKTTLPDINVTLKVICLKKMKHVLRMVFKKVAYCQFIEQQKEPTDNNE